MSEYYFVTSLLPELQIGHVPTLGYAELMQLLEVNLTKSDFLLAKDFLHLIDYENLRHLWKGEPLDKRGNYTQAELEKALAEFEWPNEREFPDFLREYLQKYPTNQERLDHFFWLISQFLDYQIGKHTGFLRDFYIFEKEWRIVMVGFRAAKYTKDVAYELQYEDPDNPIVAEVLAQKDTESFEPPSEYQELKPIFEEYGDAPLELHKMFIEYQFRHIIEILGGKIFSMDRILGYMARLILVEKWQELNIQQGISIIDQIVEDVK